MAIPVDMGPECGYVRHCRRDQQLFFNSSFSCSLKSYLLKCSISWHPTSQGDERLGVVSLAALNVNVTLQAGGQLSCLLQRKRLRYQSSLPPTATSQLTRQVIPSSWGDQRRRRQRPARHRPEEGKAFGQNRHFLKMPPHAWALIRSH